MEPTSGTRSNTTKVRKLSRATPGQKGADMDHILALVLALLPLSLCVALPGALDAMDVEKMKSKVTWKAQGLVARIDKHFPDRGLRFDTDKVEGSTSVVASLESYNNLISDRFGGVSQIKTEISSLAGYLNHWREGNCQEQQPKVWPRRNIFNHTVSLEALMRVREFLKLLQKNVDLLERC
ncbi:leptin isoform X1 [Takifugu rubripes]|nr:leptin isoform X1 [Takifugu rubripes]|eukprot:XP_011605187.1 PREDICTED: leptin isoform X1 [Takifugu rubripes]